MRIKETPALFGKIGIELLVRPIINDIEATTCSTYWELKTDSGEVLANGNTNLTEEEYAAWGADNDYVGDLVLTQLGLERYVGEDTE